MEKVLIIAEAGINHNGSSELAKKMIDLTSEVGADAIKFQAFKSEKLATPHTPKAKYQKRLLEIDESQYEMLKKYELDRNTFREMKKYCEEEGILFLCSAFDLESIEFLFDLGLEIFKIPSGEITNSPYLRKIGVMKKKVILSTGMSDLGEIEDALNILIKSGTKKEDITVLHCNSEYPSPYSDVNLKAMLTIKEAFKIDVGYSDHTIGIEVPIAAVALGARVIEKHFTLNRKMEGPDHRASLEPEELKQMIKAIRNIELSLGTGIKECTQSEKKNKLVVRKSIVASRSIFKDEILSEENITVKRPGTGINPMLWDKVMGKRAIKDFKRDEFIEI